MKLGKVIGRLTLNLTVPALHGARWLIISPFTRDHFPHDPQSPPALSKEPTLIVYDNLGGNLGDVIGYVEGREAAMPFEQDTPIDAVNVALITDIFHTPAP